MSDIETLMSSILDHCNEKGKIFQDDAWTSNGCTLRTTKYLVDGKDVYIETKDGKVRFLEFTQ